MLETGWATDLTDQTDLHRFKSRVNPVLSVKSVFYPVLTESRLWPDRLDTLVYRV